jgi:hypothetical protein
MPEMEMIGEHHVDILRVLPATHLNLAQTGGKVQVSCFGTLPVSSGDLVLAHSSSGRRRLWRLGRARGSRTYPTANEGRSHSHVAKAPWRF